MNNWGPIWTLMFLALSCGGPSGSEDEPSSSSDEDGAGGGTLTGGATAGGGAAASGGIAGSGGVSQADGYYFEAVLDGTPYRLTEVYARPHPSGSGFELYGNSDDVSYGFILFFEPNEVGTFECDGGNSLYMAAHLDVVDWTDLFDPEGSCILELTEVGSEIRGTFSGQLYRIQPSAAPLIVSEGRFFVPFN